VSNVCFLLKSQNKHYDTGVKYHYDALNISWVPSLSPVPIGGFATNAQLQAAAAAAVAAQAANNGTETKSSSNDETTSGSVASSLVNQRLPQSYSFYESMKGHLKDSNDGEADGIGSYEYTQFLRRQWNFNLENTEQWNMNNILRSNMLNIGIQNERDNYIHINATWASMLKDQSQTVTPQEDIDWSNTIFKIIKKESSKPAQKIQYNQGVANLYPDPLLYPNVNDIGYSGRNKCGKSIDNQSPSIIPTFLSTIEEIYQFLNGPLRRAIVAVRNKEAETMNDYYTSSSFWKNDLSTSTSSPQSSSSNSKKNGLNGRPTPYDENAVVGRTDIFNNSYIHLVGRSVGPGLVIEQKQYLNSHCNEKSGILNCQSSVSDEWIQAPKNIITADTTSSYANYYTSMKQLQSSSWLHSRNTAMVRLRGVIYNSNVNLALSWSIELKKTSSASTIFIFQNVVLDVFQIDQLNTPIQRVVGIITIINFGLLGYVGVVEINRCKRIKIVNGHYKDAMRSFSLWGSILMMLFFVIHLLLRMVYFFNDDRRNFDIISKDLTKGLPSLSFISIYLNEHVFLTIVTSLGWFRMLNYLMLSSRIWFTLKVIKNSFKKSIYYLSLFCVPLLAYSFCGHYMFGTRIEEFHTLSSSIETVLIMTFGTFQDNVLSRYPMLGAIYMFSFYVSFFRGGYCVTCCCVAVLLCYW
jgi:hypothetical protein